MENKMKKLIALFAVTSMASTAAVASVALSGSASVSYDDNGTAASATSYDADMTIVGTAGGQIFESTDTGVTISLDVPIGDATVALDNSGNVILSGTWSGVTLSHTVGDTTSTTASVALAGIDVNVTNKAGTTTWDLATTVSGIDITLASTQKVTAAFGLAGNTMTVSSIPEVAAAAATTGTANGTGTDGYGVRTTSSVASYSTVAISRDLTSGATLTATYSTLDDSLTLKAAVTF
jgi:hypothetical protein